MDKRIAIPVIGILLVVTWFTYKPEKPHPIRNAPPAKPTIVAFGDSLTFGTGGGKNGSYPSQLSARIGREIINLGVPGETTESAIVRLDDVVMYDPGIVLITLGGNDIKNGVPKQETFQNLELIIQFLQDEGAMVVLGGINIPILGRDFTRRYHLTATRMGAVLVPDIYEGIFGKSEFMSDRIHPNGRGYGKMAGHFYDALEPYLNP
ncbi:arylesterase [Desulfoluna limicola]|uniref:Arylesterase n=1 Tax=Desulfoluna limicola TaxID=2810562 RepID=A0ABM7PGS3_9BACT|nr:GDSL-type esterase/lipase family protein [Desulfoluna limicola]BCS96534.1 arylesterase [Desulfoluna limicola]